MEKGKDKPFRPAPGKKGKPSFTEEAVTPFVEGSIFLDDTALASRSPRTRREADGFFVPWQIETAEKERSEHSTNR